MVCLKSLLFEETLARMVRACKKNFLFYWRNKCSTGRRCSKADQRLTRVSFPFVKKTFLWIIFSVIFKSVQSSTCWQNEAESRVRFSPGAWKFPLSQASKVSPPSKLKMFTGSVCVLLTSVSLKSIKMKKKINLRNQECVRKKKWRVKGKWRRLILFFFLWSESNFILFLFFYPIRVDPSWSDPDWRSELIGSDFWTCPAKIFVCLVQNILHVMMKWCRRASHLGRFTLQNNGRRATQLGRFTLWHYGRLATHLSRFYFVTQQPLSCTTRRYT